jgi:DNA topoisomerase-1
MPKIHATTPPPRFTEASLVKRLEDEGIGRPSTYAPTISTIQQREYVVKRNGALIPTYVGMAVVHLLRSHFDHYIDLKFTARMEESLDEIAEGTTDWVAFLSKFYKGNGNPEEGLISVIKKELPNIEFPAIEIGIDPQNKQPIIVRIGRNSAYVQRGEGGEGNSASIPVDLLIDELSAEKALELLGAQSRGKEPIGMDPVTQKNVYALLGPYGPYVQLGESDKENKPKRVSLPKGVRLQDVDFDYAMKLLSLPRTVGIDPQSGLPIIAGVGRYGPYVQRDGVYKKLDSDGAIFTVTLEQAVELLATAKKRSKEVLKDLGAHPENGKKVEVVNGRYGPYVTDGKLNATIPKGDDPLAVSLEQAVGLLQVTAEKNGKKPGKRSAKTATEPETVVKAAVKKTAAKKPAQKKSTAKPRPTTKARKVTTAKKETTPKKLTPSRIVAKSGR